MTTEAAPLPVLAGRDARTLVLSAWSAVSGYGVGREALRDGVLAGRPAVSDLDPSVHPGPFGRGGVVPGFDAASHLGRKGTRTMNRATAIAVTMVDCLVAECGPELTEDPERIGLVLGAGAGSVQTIMDFTRGSLTNSKPYHVDAIRFPNTFMNRAAGHCAIWHGLKGPNSTIAGGWLTGLLALSYAVRLHRGGHCPRVLFGATEEYSEQRAWLEYAARGHVPAGPPLGEGGAVFLLESAAEAASAGRTPLARVLGTHFRAYGEESEARTALADCVREALERAGVAPSDVTLVVPLGDSDGPAELEEAAVLDSLGAATPEWLRCRPLLGDTFAAATSLQIAAALAAGDSWAAAGNVALVTGIDRDGTVGCALLGNPA